MNSTFETIHYDGEWAELDPSLRDQLLQLDRDFFVRPWPKAGWRQLLEDSGREFQLSVLVQKKRVVGFVLFLLEREDRRAHLVKILCHPEIRGQGLGHELLRSAQLRLALQFKIFLLDLEVETSNAAALGLYRKLGYKKMRVLKDLYGESLHGVAMQAQLGPI